MHPIKRRVLELVAADRIRQRDHFKRQAQRRGIALEDALLTLRRGAPLAGQADTDAEYGRRHRFRGRDASERLLDVIVSIDEERDCLWLHSVFRV